MAKICITGAGSAQSNGVINCLLLANEGDEIIGLGSEPSELIMCNAHKKYLLPHSKQANYKEALLNVLAKEKPDMLHFQHDMELSVALRFRDEIESLNVRMLVPDYQTIDTCVHKYKSWKKFKENGIKVPNSMLIHNSQDLELAFQTLGNSDGFIWLRSINIGGGGKGSLPTNNFKEAYEWIERHDGWGIFAAAELLTKDTVTWLSIWKDGELIVAQTRRRKKWAYSELNFSGVTGVTKIGETCSDPIVDEVAEKAIRAVSSVPNGIYGVDMAYDAQGYPNPTEINIARFFTTVQFFAEAGLNMPNILKNLVLYDKRPDLSKKINPLDNGLLWLRAMDCPPMLTTEKKIEDTLIKLW